MYKGQRELGIELARRAWGAIVCRWWYAWDQPNITRGDMDTGERRVIPGTGADMAYRYD